MSYLCAFGCTSYNPSCDACDDEVSDQTWGWAEPEETTDNRFQAALNGQSLREFLDDDDNW